MPLRASRNQRRNRWQWALCGLIGHRSPGKRSFRRRASGKGFGHFIRFDLPGWSTERTGLARCARNETRAAGAETGSADTL